MGTGRQRGREKERKREYQGLLVVLFQFSSSFFLSLPIGNVRRVYIYISLFRPCTTIQRILNHGGDREYVYIYIYLFIRFSRKNKGVCRHPPPRTSPPPPLPKPVKCVPEETGAFVDAQSSMIEERARAPVHRIPTPAAGYIGAD